MRGTSGTYHSALFNSRCLGLGFRLVLEYGLGVHKVLSLSLIPDLLKNDHLILVYKFFYFNISIGFPKEFMKVFKNSLSAEFLGF